jgi:hypothetical protein
VTRAQLATDFSASTTIVKRTCGNRGDFFHFHISYLVFMNFALDQGKIHEYGSVKLMATNAARGLATALAPLAALLGRLATLAGLAPATTLLPVLILLFTTKPKKGPN